MKKASPQEKLFVMVMSWLVPGFGFYRNGLKARGVFFFITLELTFLVGACFRGSVLLPDFSPHSEGFNLVAILTFFTQMFNGLLGLVSLVPDLLGRFGLRFSILPYNETSQWYDLGSFYLLISGGMNYFVLTSTYDHFYGRKADGADAAAGEGEGEQA